MVDLLENALSSAESEAELRGIAEVDPAVERERRAYLDLHATLLEQYPGKHVAIHGGELVDVDDDFEVLLARIERRFPDVFVWLAQVNDLPTPTFNLRSPRFLPS